VARGAALLARSPWAAEVEKHSQLVALTDDGTLVVASAEGALTALDSITGQRLWECAAAANEDDPIALIGHDSRGRVVVVHESGRVRVIDGGTSQDLSVRIGPWPKHRATIRYDTLFFADGDGRLHAFDLHSESDRWTLPGSDRLSGAPFAANGVLFVATAEGRVIAVDAATGRSPAQPKERKTSPAPSLKAAVEHRDGTVILRAPDTLLPSGPFIVAAMILRIGDDVSNGQLLMELRSGPHTVEIRAPVTGTVTELPFRLADWVGPDAALATISPAARGQPMRRARPRH
jgi:outer membrane protein assembly factor BamB